MTAIFPTNPNIGDTFPNPNPKWEWNGVKWSLIIVEDPASKSDLDDEIINRIKGDIDLSNKFIPAFETAVFDNSERILALSRFNGEVVNVTIPATENTDEFVDGASFDTSNNILTLTRDKGEDLLIDLSNLNDQSRITDAISQEILNRDTAISTSINPLFDDVSFNSTTRDLTLTKVDNSSITVNIPATTNTDDFVNGATFTASNNILTLTRETGSDITVDLTNLNDQERIANAINPLINNATFDNSTRDLTLTTVDNSTISVNIPEAGSDSFTTTVPEYNNSLDYQVNKLIFSNILNPTELYKSNFNVPAGEGDPSTDPRNIEPVNTVDISAGGITFAVIQTSALNVAALGNMIVEIPNTHKFKEGQQISLLHPISNKIWSSGIVKSEITTTQLGINFSQVDYDEIALVANSQTFNTVLYWDAAQGFQVQGDIGPYWTKQTDHSQVEINKDNIQTNITNIQTNTDNIETNTNNIQTNTTNIETNTTDIETNKNNIDTNTDNITTNTTNINSNTLAIDELHSEIIDPAINKLISGQTYAFAQAVGGSDEASINVTSFDNYSVGDTLTITNGFRTFEVTIDRFDSEETALIIHFISQADFDAFADNTKGRFIFAGFHFWTEEAGIGILIPQNNTKLINKLDTRVTNNTNNINTVQSEYLKNVSLAGDTVTINDQDNNSTSFDINAFNGIERYTSEGTYLLNQYIFGNESIHIELYKALKDVPADAGDPGSNPGITTELVLQRTFETLDINDRVVRIDFGLPVNLTNAELNSITSLTVRKSGSAVIIPVEDLNDAQPIGQNLEIWTITFKSGITIPSQFEAGAEANLDAISFDPYWVQQSDFQATSETSVTELVAQVNQNSNNLITVQEQINANKVLSETNETNIEINRFNAADYTWLLTGGFLLTEGIKSNRQEYVGGEISTSYYWDDSDNSWYNADTAGDKLIGF